MVHETVCGSRYMYIMVHELVVPHRVSYLLGQAGRSSDFSETFLNYDSVYNKHVVSVFLILSTCNLR